MARSFNINVQVYSESQQVTRAKDTFAFMFTNIGDTPARVNGMVIFPALVPGTTLGDSRTVSGHEDELYLGNITLAFDPGGANPQVEVVQSFYVDEPK